MATEPIPGLELPTPKQSQIEKDVEATIDELERLNLLKPHHAAAVGLCRLAARKLSAIAEHGQAYGVAMLMRELREGLSGLPEVDSGDAEREAWNALVAAMSDD